MSYNGSSSSAWQLTASTRSARSAEKEHVFNRQEGNPQMRRTLKASFPVAAEKRYIQAVLLRVSTWLCRVDPSFLPRNRVLSFTLQGAGIVCV